jgi:hypothetical protein
VREEKSGHPSPGAHEKYENDNCKFGSQIHRGVGVPRKERTGPDGLRDDAPSSHSAHGLACGIRIWFRAS